MSDTWNSAPLAPTAPAVTGTWDSAPLVGPSTQQKAVLSATDNGEEAARAVAVGKKTGIPATVVQSDLPGYDAHTKQQSAIRASQNPALAKYIDSDPMAAKISSDDWDHLDIVSKTVKALSPQVISENSHRQVVNSIPELNEALSTAPGRTKLANALANLPFTLLEDVVDTTRSGTTGALEMLKAPATRLRAGGQDSFWGGFVNQFKDLGSVGVGAAGIAMSPFLPILGAAKTAIARPLAILEGEPLQKMEADVGKALLAIKPAGGLKVTPNASGATGDLDSFLSTVRGKQTRSEIDEFLRQKAEGEGPPGAMLQIEHAKAGGEALDKAVEVAQASKTKARSPELFEEAAAAHDPGNVHIDAAKIVELYQKEGKVPAEGDGLFGFVPDIAAKAQAAAATGGEVTISVAKYIAHVDPSVHEGLKDAVRLHDDGVTALEAEDAKASIEAWHGTPHDFEQFDLTKIGTGEGAQVYGHGLYFAQAQKVGENYRDQLAPGPSVGQQRFNANDPQHIAAQAIHEAGHIDEAQVNLEKKLARFNDKNDPFEAERGKIKQAIKELDNIASTGQPTYDPGTKGQLYKVSISADPTHFLDWDLPLAKQSQHVQDVIRKLNKDEEFESLLDAGDAIKRGHYPGTFDINSPEFAKLYSEAGIPGIKYLDQGSRPGPGAMTSAGMKLDKPTLTRNFVVFDDRLVKITEKNGEPIAALLEAQAETEKLSLGLDTRVFMSMLFKDQKALNITPVEFKKYSDLIARQEQAVLDRAVSVSKAQVARALTPEWKRNEAAVTTEVTQEFKEQGIFAAERYLRQNKIELGGENIEQIADDLAPLWGFDSGDALRRALTDLEIVQAADRKSVQVQEREAIKAAVSARMEERYGNLAENIAQEARQIALADHAFDVLAAEVRILANAAGVSPPLSRAEMVDWAKRSFESSNVVDAANWEKHRRAVERGGREAEKALLKGDFLEAFQAKQRQMLAATVAKESFAFQKVVDGAEKKIDRFSSEEVIPSIDQAHLEQLRQMLASIGLPQQFAPLAGTESLRDFTDASQGQIAAAPWLMDGTQPKLQDMSVEQFRDFVKSMQSLEHAGRDAMKLENAYGEALLANTVGDIVKSLERFPFINQPAHPSIAQRASAIGRQVIGMHLLVERAFDYTDKFDPHGPITEWLDRPLRDANSKEITLTEQVMRMLKDARQFVDKSINDKIENNLIPDANDKSGFLAMTRQDLRNLMLNTGNWSNLKKATEGFGINEADLRRFIDKNATAKDVSWVNAVWDVFAYLKPEADAVQFKDTGVPVDTIPAVPWQVKAGDLKGGYYPLAYDKYNSDINSRVARPLFDNGYFAATTSHGYTEARTEYAGALDLTGAFLSAKIQGMVHDIAFRMAVRNANKLIENQEFRTAVAQYWGKETADLLPGWIRDIANSHNLDDNYARGFVRAAALIRQNVVSTLIAYNPGTFIKHGFTAAVMSVDRVGLGKLLEASGDLGWSQVPKNIRDLVSKSDRIPDEAFMQSFRDLLDQGERGENARQFVLDSSPVMRNRQRQYEDSIRGATDALTNIGIAQTLATFRQRQMQYGRLAVAFSDQMSAMPTWLAAYKKAYQAGESHADAVFIADKEMSRAHGSSFVGDQPAVTRIKNGPTGELARWFVPLYKFWNHQVNNNFQLAWDASAAFGGNAGAEPGANAASITRRVAYVMGIILIEEMASAAKDEDKHGLLQKALLASLRYFGAGFVGAREITNGLAGGYEPSTGLIGTLFKAGSDTVKDIGKATGTKAGLAKDWIKHTATTLGFLTGVGGSQVGRTGQFGANVVSGRERPINLTDWRQGLRTGSMKARKH